MLKPTRRSGFTLHELLFVLFFLLCLGLGITAAVWVIHVLIHFIYKFW